VKQTFIIGGMTVLPCFRARQPPRTYRVKKGRHPDVDDAVLHFVKETQAKVMPITRQAMQVKPTETAKSLGITNFEPERGWRDRFMRREGLSLRHRASICQKIPADFQEKLLNFQRYVNKLGKKKNYAFKQKGNADETAIYFDMPRNYTVDAKGAKEVKIISTGYEKQRVMVMLCINSDGHKLPPYIIHSRKTIHKNEMFLKDIIVLAQKMDG
jgi:hypothetical protein